jgi:hypothetical protein
VPVRSALREEFLADIIICAVEGGTNYWAYSARYRHDDSAHTKVYLGVMEEVDELGNPNPVGSTDSQPWYYIDIERVARALTLIRSGKVSMNTQIQQTIKQADAENDATDIDATCADVIMQVACFGEIVYG